MTTAEPLNLAIDDAQPVSGLLQLPANPRACLVLAHGAGAGMTHPFMATTADALADRGIATLRYNFPYMERRSKRVDAPATAHAAVRAAVAQARASMPGVPLFAGGKSFGGRMTSQAQAQSALPEVRGLVFLGFPLHPPGKPSDERAKHLADARVPMLFLQGTRDEFAQPELLQAALGPLAGRATLHLIDGADHSFRVPKRDGGAVLAELAAAMTDWMGEASFSGRKTAL